MLGRLFCLFTCLTLSLSAVPQTKDKVDAPKAAETLDTWDGSFFRIEDTKTRVSIASVKLSVGDLKPEGKTLVGEYTINVPLMQSKNDKGKIVLPLDVTIQEIGDQGGILHGQAISYKDGTTPNIIVCEILPDQGRKVLLEITTDDRTLQFKSKYSIVKIPEDS